MANFKVLWNKSIEPSYETGNLPVVFNSGIISGDQVFLGHNKGTFKSLNLNSGKTVWEKYDGGHYYSKPLIVENSVVYGNSEGRVFSRSIADGELNFEVVLGEPVESSPAHKGGRVLFHLRNHQVFCLDVKTGKTIWSFKKSVADVTTLQTSSTPVIYGNYAYVGFGDGSVGKFRMETGEQVWETSIGNQVKFNDVDSSPIVENGNVYAFASGQQLVSLDDKTGIVLNRYDYYPSGEFSFFGGKIFFGGTNGNLYSLDPYSDQFQNHGVVAKSAIKYIRPWKSGVAIFSMRGKVFFKNLNTAQVNSNYFSFGSDDSLILSSPDVTSSSILVNSSRGRVVLLR